MDLSVGRSVAPPWKPNRQPCSDACSSTLAFQRPSKSAPLSTKTRHGGNEDLGIQQPGLPRMYLVTPHAFLASAHLGLNTKRPLQIERGTVERRTPKVGVERYTSYTVDIVDGPLFLIRGNANDSLTTSYLIDHGPPVTTIASPLPSAFTSIIPDCASKCAAQYTRTLQNSRNRGLKMRRPSRLRLATC